MQDKANQSKSSPVSHRKLQVITDECITEMICSKTSAFSKDELPNHDHLHSLRQILKFRFTCILFGEDNPRMQTVKFCIQDVGHIN